MCVLSLLTLQLWPPLILYLHLRPMSPILSDHVILILTVSISPTPLVLRAPPSVTLIQWHCNPLNPDPPLMAALVSPLLSQKTPFLYSYLLSIPTYFLPVFLNLLSTAFESYEIITLLKYLKNLSKIFFIYT